MNFSNLPPMHPALVHFPIALIAVSFLCDFLGRISRNDSLRAAGWWCLILGALSTVVTVPLGYFDMNRAMLDDDTHEYVDLHERIGWILLMVVVVLTVWRSKYRFRSELPVARFYLFAAFLATGLTFFQGWFGGEMVYAHGAGVAPTQQGTQTETEAKKPLSIVKEALNKVPGLHEDEAAHHHHSTTFRESAGANSSETNEVGEHHDSHHEHEH